MQRSSRSVGFLAWFVALAPCGAGCDEQEVSRDDTFRPAVSERQADGSVRIREDSLPFVEVQTIGQNTVPAWVRAPGRVAFRDGAVSEVGSPTDGRVTEVLVRVGQRVEAGEPLVSIASPSAAGLRGELARARVMVRAAQAELVRQEQMRERGIGIESERVRAEAEVAEARALVASLAASARSIGRGSAATVVVRAPLAGTVLERRATVGAAVDSGGEPLLVIGEPGALWIVADVFEREVPLVREGAAARLDIASIGTPLSGHVEAIGGAVDPESRRAPVYLRVDGDVSALRAGMYARSLIEIEDVGIGIPASAVLIKDGGRTEVFVLRDERTFVAREVTVGAAVEGRVPVLTGLAAGDSIVTRGALLLDGQAELLR
jgi:cobalt-zinc-cadmium efflux system membrane fusion protein